MKKSSASGVAKSLIKRLLAHSAVTMSIKRFATCAERRFASTGLNGYDGETKIFLSPVWVLSLDTRERLRVESDNQNRV